MSFAVKRELSRLEMTLIDLWCRDNPCTVHRAFHADAKASGRADDDAAFYDTCLEVCEAVHFCPLRLDRVDGVADELPLAYPPRKAA